MPPDLELPWSGNTDTKKSGQFRLTALVVYREEWISKMDARFVMAVDQKVKPMFRRSEEGAAVG